MSHVLRRFQNRILWIATFAVLFGSVAPSLTNWLASSTGQAWVEVCTSTGTQLLALDADQAPEKQKPPHTGDHCPYCRLQQDLPAVAHAPGVMVLADGSVRGVPFPAAPAPLRAAALWPAHLSRGPPQLS